MGTGCMNATPSWLSLAPDEVHVWWIDLSRMSGGGDELLSPDERARANRFRQERDCRRWVAARAALRQILAQYAGDKPESLCLQRGAHGKPELTGQSPLRFSLSHALDRAALAVAWQREVGVDLEPCDPELPRHGDLAALIATICTPSEIARIEALPEADRRVAFLKHWTLKEAYLKGIGAGLAREPRTVEVSSPAISFILSPSPSALGEESLTSRGDANAAISEFNTPLAQRTGRGVGGEGQRRSGDMVPSAHQAPLDELPWTLRLLDPGLGWTAALAVAGDEPEVCYRQWPPPSESIA